MPMISQNRATSRQPRLWSDIKGQDYVVNKLTTDLREGKFSPVYLFVGPSGCGKTSAAFLMGAALVCNDRQGVDPCWNCKACKAALDRTCPDMKFVDGTADRSLAFVKEQLIPFMERKPWHSPHKNLTIDEAHQYKIDAMSAFLTVFETLHKRGPETFVILCTT